MVTDDVVGFDDIRVLECRSNAELGGDLLVVFLLRFACSSRSKLLDGIDHPSILGFPLNQANSTTCTRSQRPPKFSVFFGDRCMSRIGEGRERTVCRCDRRVAGVGDISAQIASANGGRCGRTLCLASMVLILVNRRETE